MSGEGNGGGHRRRRADRSSRTDRAAKRWATCLVQVVALLVVVAGTAALVWDTYYR